MKQTTRDNITTYSFDIFEKYPEILNAASTRMGGTSINDYSSLNVGFHVGDDKEKVIKNRKLLAIGLQIDADTLTCGEQVHGAQVEVVTPETAGRGARSLEDAFVGTDALVSNVRGVPLMVQTADCAAVSFYDPEKHAVGIAHAGRKGAKEGIVLKTIEKMRVLYKTTTQELIVGIGPCIHPCCYDMDLVGKIREQIISTGVKPENIEDSGICTSCHNDIFFSYRADGKVTGRFANMIMIHK